MRPFLTLPSVSWPEEHMAAFWSFTDDNRAPLREVADMVEKFIAPWLAEYSVNRITYLFDCLAKVREPILVWAAYTGRLDVLVGVHDRYDLGLCSDNLLVAGMAHLDVLTYLHNIGYQAKAGHAAEQAAIHGHESSLKFLLPSFQVAPGWLGEKAVAGISCRGHSHIFSLLLTQLVGTPHLLHLATTFAASYSHMSLANWLHSQWMHLNLPLALHENALNDALWIASSGGFLDGLQWLMQVFVVDTTELVEAVTLCLSSATRYGHHAVVDWLVPQATPRVITDIFFRDDIDGTLLIAAIDPTIEIDADDVANAMYSWSLDKLQRVLDTFESLHRPGPTRTATLKTWLFKAVTDGRVEFVPWLVECLDPDDVRSVVCFQRALFRGMHKGGVPLLVLFESMDMHLPHDVMDITMYVSLRQEPDKSMLPSWLEDNDNGGLDDTNQVARWCMTRRGGRVATLGRLLVRLSQGKKTFEQFNLLYATWLPLADDASKQAVLKSCVQTTNHEIFQFLESRVPSYPHMFVFIAMTRRLGPIRRCLGILADSMTPDELLRVQCDALVESAAAGYSRVMQFLATQIDGQNQAAIIRAREAAVAHGKTAMVSLLRDLEQQYKQIGMYNQI
ncbi:Aste57867_890 [Aphanomyces stellatus]|uniref:Aste57867_890 protein n=1 Tax=Aphanomyces stellatus TaxID=120398 RepID=A0A485K918_9STRA|nr:hypothetical protein As57867_000889 [Aphanomyces stellatus]VFT78114.1 Aste57867_890 [Aphanomyces stellatus]